MIKLIYGTLIVCFTFIGCARIYHSPDAISRANDHKVIAIIPPKVSIAPMRNPRNVNPTAILEYQNNESFNFQQEMQSWLLKRKTQNNIFVEIQDVQITNAKLQRVGYFGRVALTPAEICEILEVDGVISSSYYLSKPMSTGAALAVGVLVGIWGPTNQTIVSMEVHDAATHKMIWNFNHKLSGSVGSSSARLVNSLMRKASKRMPYIQKSADIKVALK